MNGQNANSRNYHTDAEGVANDNSPLLNPSPELTDLPAFQKPALTPSLTPGGACPSAILGHSLAFPTLLGEMEEGGFFTKDSLVSAAKVSSATGHTSQWQRLPILMKGCKQGSCPKMALLALEAKAPVWKGE